MRRSLARQMLMAGVALAAFFFGVAPLASAIGPAQDSRSLVWEHFDVTIDEFDTTENRFRVTELYSILVERGKSRFGTAEIPMDRMNDIISLEVYENGRALREGCSGAEGTYCVRSDGSTL